MFLRQRAFPCGLSACGSRYASQARAAGSVACPGWRDDFGSLGSRAVHRGFCAPSFVSNKCPIYGQECPKTSMHRYGHLLRTLKAFRNTQGHLWTVLRLSHGENRGSSPLGSASDSNALATSCRRRRYECLLFVYYTQISGAGMFK